MHASVKFAGFFVLRVLFAVTAVLLKYQLFRCVNLVAVGDVVGTFTHGADQCEQQSLFFGSHMQGLYRTCGSGARRLFQQSVVDDGFEQNF